MKTALVLLGGAAAGVVVAAVAVSGYGTASGKHSAATVTTTAAAGGSAYLTAPAGEGASPVAPPPTVTAGRPAGAASDTTSPTAESFAPPVTTGRQRPAGPVARAFTVAYLGAGTATACRATATVQLDRRLALDPAAGTAQETRKRAASVTGVRVVEVLAADRLAMNSSAVVTVAGPAGTTTKVNEGLELTVVYTVSSGWRVADVFDASGHP